jgi:hypothetical protein
MLDRLRRKGKKGVKTVSLPVEGLDKGEELLHNLLAACCLLLAACCLLLAACCLLLAACCLLLAACPENEVVVGIGVYGSYVHNYTIR